MFLVAELVWINLCGQTSIAGLHDELASLPTDLNRVDQAYAFTIHSAGLSLPGLDMKGSYIRSGTNQSGQSAKKPNCSWSGSFAPNGP